MSAWKRIVIDDAILPIRLPLWHTIVAALAMDVWNAADILRGAIWAFFALLWALYIIGKWNEVKKRPAGFEDGK